MSMRGCLRSLTMGPLATVLPIAVLLCMGPGASALMAQGAPRTEPPDPLTPKLELMLKSMRIARDWHVGRPGKPELVAGAIDGLLARIDPEAEIYSRADLRRIPRVMPSGVAAVGLEIRREPPVRRQERRGYRVVSSRDGSPAALAGLKAGDLITQVDGRPAGEIPHLAMAHVALAGNAGSSVELTIERVGDEAPADVRLVRTDNAGPAITTDEVAPGIVRIRLAAIDAKAIDELIGPAAAPLASDASRGLILDLRSTTDGSADDVAAIADAFLDAGPVVRIDARGSGRRKNSATPGDIAAGRPIVVLVDGGTAGAAEALAAALKESHRARLVGTKTAGRGAVRTLVPLGPRGEKGALRMTTARLLAPSGAPIEGKGLVPEVVVEQAPASPGCRTLDIGDKTAPGRCVRRATGEDAQLGRAIALLDDALVAAKGAPSTPRP